MNAATSLPRKFSPSPRPTTSGELRRAPTTTSGCVGMNGDEGERALQPAADRAHRLGQVAVSTPAPSRCATTSVSVSERSVDAGVLELGAQRGEVLDDAVVDDGDLAGWRRGAGARCGRSGRRAWPSGCARCRRSLAGSGCSASSFSRLASLPALAADLQAAPSGRRPRRRRSRSRGTPAAAGPRRRRRQRLLVTDVTHDSAHAHTLALRGGGCSSRWLPHADGRRRRGGRRRAAPARRSTASTITRTSGSVPLGRSSTRPVVAESRPPPRPRRPRPPGRRPAPCRRRGR